jgi:hypothetical protein
MRIIIFALLFMSTTNTRSQQRIFLYAVPETVMIKGFDTTAPFMDYYPANNPSTGKTAVLICPGGGYTNILPGIRKVLYRRGFSTIMELMHSFYVTASTMAQSRRATAIPHNTMM